MSKPENPPAFPSQALGTDGLPQEEAQYGMSLRDYVAARVLGGMAARDCYDPGQATPADRARLAFIDADAFLAEREK